jgi:hypothetical protein
MDNSIGMIVEMERNEVDDNRDNTCSSGLHFCSESYLKSFGGARTVIVKINPRDVVSIPSDYNDAKGRACRYEVIGEVNVNPDDTVEFNKPVQENANSVPVKSEPKTGSTIFYRGYTDGYTSKQYNPDYSSLTDQRNYEEGFDKGQLDREDSLGERYRYIVPDKTQTGSWPLPKKP